MLSIIIPTIRGREESLDRTRDAYDRTAPDAEQIIVYNQPSWGHACNFGYKKATGDVIHFGADDLEPLPGWTDDVLQALDDHDELPAPRVLNHSAEGVHDNRHDGPDRALTKFTRVPILTRDQYERIGPWPEYNYVADVWLSGRARAIGIQTRLYYSYAFVHHWSQIGRTDSPAELAHATRILRDLAPEMA